MGIKLSVVGVGLRRRNGRPRGCHKTQKSNKKKWQRYMCRHHERFTLFPTEPKKETEASEASKASFFFFFIFYLFFPLSLSPHILSIDTQTNGVNSSRRKATSQLNLCQTAAVDNVVHFPCVCYVMFLFFLVFFFFFAFATVMPP